MAWLAVGLHGGEAIFDSKPIRNSHGDLRPTGVFRSVINLPPGSIAKLIGRELTWIDEPYELE